MRSLYMKTSGFQEKRYQQPHFSDTPVDFSPRLDSILDYTILS